HEIDALESDRLAVPEAERAAREVGRLEDRVEARGARVRGRAVARGPEERGTEPHPVHVVGKLQRSEKGQDVRPLSREGVEGVGTERGVRLVGDVDVADMAVAGPPEVR